MQKWVEKMREKGNKKYLLNTCSPKAEEENP